MKHFRLFLLSVLLIFFGTVSSAAADPITSTIVAVSTWVAANAAAIALAVSVGTTLLALATMPKNTGATSGVKTSTSTGGITPQTFIMGTYATAGHLAAPLMSYGEDGKTPNAYLTYVVMLGSIPGQLLYRIIVNDDYCPIGGTLENIGGSTVQGYPIGGIVAGNAWIRYHDGSQTTADDLLIDKFSSYPDRPWSSTMVGKGKPYAVVVFKFNQEVLNSPPKLKFEMGGIPLYDPRYDTTVGGSGSQRWGDASTYVSTDNLAVQIYNIHRGITLPDGSIWGGIAEAEDLPLDNWFAAFNECDTPIDLEGGGTEPQFTGGCEVSVDQQPADVMDKLGTCCNAQQVEIGGYWKIRIGGPGLPVAYFTDDDILVDQDETENMFPSLEQTNNGIQATHPLPSALWEASDAPPRYNSTWEAEDDGQRLVANLSLPCVYSPTQAQRIMTSVIADSRRMRRHSLSMGPYASMFEPLDSIAWTSTRNGYTTKVFEINQTVEGLRTINMNMAMRERDSADFSWDVSDQLPWVAALPGSNLPVAQAVSGFSVTGSYVEDSTGTARRAAIVMEWDEDGAIDVKFVKWEIRVAATLADVASGTADILKGGIKVAEGILGSTEYQARAQYVADRPTDWTSWINVTTPDVRFSNLDMPEDVINSIDETALQTLANSLEVRNLAGLLQATIFDPTGKSIQTIAIDSKNVSDYGITILNLIGSMSADRTAFVFNMSDVFVDDTTSFASYLTGVQSSLDDNTASITELFTTTDGLSAEVTLVTNVNGHVVGVKFGTTSTSSYFDIVSPNFRVIDNSNPANIKVPFQIIGGVNYLTDTQIDGSLAIINGSITKDGIEIGAISNTNFDINTTYATVDTSVDPTILSTTLTTTNEGKVVIDVVLWFDALHGSIFYADIYRDATRILRVPELQLTNQRQSWTVGFVDEFPPSAGHTYSVQLNVQTGADENVGLLYRYLKVTEFKR